MIKQAAIAGGILLSLFLSGCNDEPDETPDITEAIPVDAGSDESGEIIDAANAQNSSGESSDAGPNGSAGRQYYSGETESRPSAQPSRPSTMESGSNASNSSVQLEGSKLQRADPN